MSKKRALPRRAETSPGETERTESKGSTRSVAVNSIAESKERGSLKPAARNGGFSLWRELKDFSAMGQGASYLWPRWLLLRAVGAVYIFIFSGIIAEGRAMIGPHGVTPLATYLAEIKNLFPGAIPSFINAPSLFWLNTSGGMIDLLSGLGLVAAIALFLNFAPRLAVASCWILFLSFVATWADFSSAQLDRLMLETALLCVPFAPPGFRPGLGANSPPRPIAVFALRWLLFRVMFESGLVKLVSDDPHWRNFTAMDVMYETAPSPTLLGYWAHQLPHAYHVLEIVITGTAELLAPLAAVFAGRRGRWFAFAAWTVFQTGIQLTCNFGWLNTAALALGVLLLDDQMLASAVKKFPAAALRRFFAEPCLPASTRKPSAWSLYGLRACLGLQIALTVYYFGGACGFELDATPAPITAAVKPFAAFSSANGFFLYSHFDTAHRQVDFEGTNDGGKTWRTYDYRWIPQAVDRIPPFLAPRYPRIEATIQIESWSPGKYSILPRVAKELLARNPEIMRRFANDPFSDRAATAIRMRRYRLTFTDLATHRETGNFWQKTFESDFLPGIYLTTTGEFAQFSLGEADEALSAQNYRAAVEALVHQFSVGNLEAGFRLADMFIQGTGVPQSPERAFAIFTELAERREPGAEHDLGLCYEHGVGVPVDYVKAAEHYRRAADAGSLASIYALGSLAASDHLQPRDDVEGLSYLLKTAAHIDEAPTWIDGLRENLPAQIKELSARMSPEQIAQARVRAAAR